MLWKGEPMSDLIDRQKAIDAMCSACGNDCDKSEFVYDAPQDEQVIVCPEHYALTSLPSAQPERKTGRWIYEETQYKISSYRCSECGRHVLYESKSDVCEAYPYCHCGAKMMRKDGEG